ncbi:serine/threonine-protein kinase [Bacillus sp. BHET2]|uniref:serine/threonine protein kinase n=1 Tax=Bacillus sp. BHET2 TaxID=2583818 RepID=UPI0014863A68|nr:serine/threonine-protein kinase [Bacillus sp. BHET2]
MSSIRIEPNLFQIIEPIGEGGFGKVFIAKEILNSEELVALKVLKPEEMGEDHLKRFEREIRIHTQLKHQNIIPIINFELNDSLDPENERGLAYYTMPLARKNFRELLKEYREDHLGNMEDSMAVFFFNQILDGIEYAHEKEIIHRDLKPENILIYGEEGDEILKISDFGLGKFLNSDTQLTHTRAALGSDVYAAPEQYQDSKQVDNRADIFSLGKILYEIITHDLPVTINNDKISESRLKFIIRKATQSDKGRRFRSIQEMRDKINFLMGNKDTLKTTSNQFAHLYEKFTVNFEQSILKEIADLLNNNSKDYILFTQSFINMEDTDLAGMSAFYEEEFFEVVENYLSLIKGNHEFSLTDKITDFTLFDILPNIDGNLDLFEDIIETILNLGFNHNRYYIARVLGRTIVKVTDDTKIMIIGDVLTNNPQASKWSKSYLPSEEEFCEYLRSILSEL